MLFVKNRDAPPWLQNAPLGKPRGGGGIAPPPPWDKNVKYPAQHHPILKYEIRKLREIVAF